MKEGFRVYDTDTHIDPGADVLEKYVDPGFRERLDDLAPYRVAIKSRSVDGGVRHTYRFESKRYERTLGEAESRPGLARRPGVARRAAALARRRRRPLRQPCVRHGCRGLGRAFPRAVGVDQRRRPARTCRSKSG